MIRRISHITGLLLTLIFLSFVLSQTKDWLDGWAYVSEPNSKIFVSLINYLLLPFEYVIFALFVTSIVSSLIVKTFPKHSCEDYTFHIEIVGQLTGTILALWLALILVPFHQGEQILSPELLWFQLKDFLLQYPQFYLATATLVCLSPLFQKLLGFLMRIWLGKTDVKPHVVGESIIICTLVVIISSHFYIYSKSFSSKPIVYDIVNKYYILGSEEQCYKKIWKPLVTSYIQASEKGKYSEAKYLSEWLLYLYQKRFEKLRRDHPVLEKINISLLTALKKVQSSMPKGYEYSITDDWLNGAGNLWLIINSLNPKATSDSQGAFQKEPMGLSKQAAVLETKEPKNPSFQTFGYKRKNMINTQKDE